MSGASAAAVAQTGLASSGRASTRLASPGPANPGLASPGLAELDSRTRPVVLAHRQRLAVSASLSVLLPEGLQRGSTVVVGDRGQGATSLALGLLAGVSGGGGWCAVVGQPSLGLVAAAQLGLHLERLALVPEPGAQWPVVAAALIDSVDVLLLIPPSRAAPRDARRLAARARERGAVMVVMGSSWPDRGDLHLAVSSVTWSGLKAGLGYLQGRRVEVILTGRGAAVRERRAWMGLPDPSGVASPGFLQPAPVPDEQVLVEQVPVGSAGPSIGRAS